MAKTKKETDKKEKGAARQERNAQLGLEVWGVAFFGIGGLVLIALVSHLAGPVDNILGPYFNRMAAGLVWLFGPIASFVIPLSAFYAGVTLFRGASVEGRTLVFWLILAGELCVLLAIHDMPRMAAEKEIVKPNFAGHLVTYLLHYVFGVHRFGPYFVFSFAFAITLAVGLRINLRVLAFRIGLWVAAAARWAWTQFIWAIHRVWAPAPEPVPVPAAAAAAPVAAREPAPEAAAVPKEKSRGKGREEPVAPEAAAPSADGVDPEEEARSRFEEELAAFRRKRNEPIKIVTEAAATDGDEDDEHDGEVEDSEVERIARADAAAGDEGGEESGDEDEGDVGDDEAGDDEELVNPDEVLAQGGNFDEAIPGRVPVLEARRRARAPSKPYVVPSPDILPDPPVSASVIDRMEIENNSGILEKTLGNFGVEGKVINVGPGPVVTRYEIELAPGVKISRIVSLQDDLAMAVGGKKIRIEAPIPGKAAVGIELPNEEMLVVHFKHVLTSEVFQRTKYKLPIVVGKTISGLPYITDITRMPHLLIAGQTGSGKSVCINSLICSLLMTKTPDELRMIMIDPKKVEMAYYQGIPHLLAPVVTESKEAVKALQWGVGEMARRYRLLARVHARNIDSFNEKIAGKSIAEGVLPEGDNKPLPFIVIIVDELADLMLTASRDVETLIQRIAQLARAVGIHLIVATQRPSVDIITGPIKANLTSRIGFRTIQSVDSRTILGHVGAEKLLGRGDMLFLRNGAPDLERYHGAFISETDVETIVSAIRDQSVDAEVLRSFDDEAGSSGGDGGGGEESDRLDEFFEEAARLVVTTGQGSTSFVQRRLKVGYARAGRIMDELHRAGIVGPQEGSKVREILVKPDELEILLEQIRRNG